MRKILIEISFVILLSIPAVYPLFVSGFFPMHDDTQVARVYEMKNSLADGMLPVRWSEHLGYGYGYPIFNFYAPLAYYIGGIINLIGADALNATKSMIGLGMLLSAVGMYLFSRSFWGSSGAFISSMLYMYAPYHALNLYVRGAISEIWAYGLLPFTFWGLYRLFHAIADAKTKPKKYARNYKQIWIWTSVSAIAYAGVILSHNLTAMMVTPALLGFVVLLSLFGLHRKASKRKLSFLFLSLVLGVLISASYWLPVLSEMKYTNVLSVVGGGSDYPDHFVCVSQLWNSPWGFAGSAPGCVDGISFKLGKAHIALSALAVIALFIPWVKRSQKIVVVGSLFGALVSLFLLLPQSQFIWDSISPMAFFQFPWRFFILANCAIALLAGASSLLLPSKVRMYVSIVIMVGIIGVNYDIFQPSTQKNISVADLVSNKAISWEASKLSDEYMPRGFSKPKSVSEIVTEKIVTEGPEVVITNQVTQADKLTATVNSPKSSTLTIATAYFPAWKIYLDSEEVAYTQFNKGLKVRVPEGTHIFEMKFVQTPVEKAANVLSLTGVSILLAGIIFLRKEKRTIAKST